jgi:hypothetical protein
VRIPSLFLSTILVFLVTSVAFAQDRPFVFSVTTTGERANAQTLVDFQVGAGEQAFHSSAETGPEQRVGIQTTLGRWTLVGHVGLASAADAYHTFEQGEALFSILTPRSSGLAFAIGGGMLREPGGVDVALARIVVGRDYDQWRLHGNLLFQKPLAPHRDTLDVITTVGWARRLTSTVSLGVEGIGEDLEGFWNPAEAEGGARLLLGPSLHLAPGGQRWQLSVAGGPTFHGSGTGRASGAVRDLPASQRSVGYAFRTSFAFGMPF